jgi:tetratricopeptide (TPR) repeat protein
VDEARAAAARGEHAAAVERLLEALEEDSSRRGEWLVELAEQMTYSGRAAHVSFLYGELLAADALRRPRLSDEERRRVRLGRALALSWSGRLEESLAAYEELLEEDEDDRLARLGQARVLSWTGRQKAAHDAYREVLRRHPGDPEAELGLARVLSWRGRQRQAQRSLESYLEEHPDSGEAAVLLAQSQYWMGRPDRARRTLDRPPASEEGRYSGPLRDRLALETRPDLRLDFEEAHQTDNVDDPLIRTFSLEQAFHGFGGRSTLGLRYRHVRYDPELQPSQFVQVHRPGLFGRHRFSDPVELVGWVGMDLIRPEIGEDHDTLTYDVYAAFQPGDTLAFYLGSSRTTFESVRALTLNTTATYANLALAATPDDRSRFDLRTNWGDYSDGNTRVWAQLQGERRVALAPRMFVGGLVTGYRFSEILDSGYFNPERYLSTVATFRAYAWSERPLFWDVYATLGAEWADPGVRQTAWSALARLGYRINRKLVIRGRAGYVNAATASNTGYARGSVGLDLHLIW